MMAAPGSHRPHDVPSRRASGGPVLAGSEWSREGVTPLRATRRLGTYWVMFRATVIASIVAMSGLPGLARGTPQRDEAAVGSLNVTIREWDLPAPDSRPHDPAVGADGSLWYTAQKVNRLGRLDPLTGKITEYRLPTADSGPHGLAADRDGNIWYTANHAGLIGKLDRKTGKVTEYKLPDPRAEDPHTPVFDRDGVLWFTVQSGNMVGRLDPGTGRIELRQVPTPDAAPYGIAISSRGIPFFCEFGTNKLASIDPRTLRITEYPLPSRARPRRLAIAADDGVYYSDFARGYLARLDPATGKVEEWESPGGAASKPYGIAITADGMVWYSESGVQPNTIVRFDPRQHAFARAAIPSGGGVIRNMAATPDGRIFIACSGVNKVGVVERRAGPSPQGRATGGR
jgi:virginiamycin B lyase